MTPEPTTRHTPRPPGRPARHSRGGIVEATTTAMLARGTSVLRFVDISAATGIPVASLQYYFPRLVDLRRDALRELVRSELLDHLERSKDVASPWQRIVALIEGCFLLLNPDDRRAKWSLWMEYWTLTGHDAQLAVDMDLNNSLWIDAMTDIIAAGITLGEFAADLDPGRASMQIQALIDGYGRRSLAEHTEDQLASAVADVTDGAARLLGVTHSLRR